MKEIIFLGGMFFDFPIPKERQFLLKYFKSPLRTQFVKYYLCFGEIDNFVDHTGFYCERRWLEVLKKKMDKMIVTYEYFKKNFELDKLAEIESGAYKFK